MGQAGRVVTGLINPISGVQDLVTGGDRTTEEQLTSTFLSPFVGRRMRKSRQEGEAQDEVRAALDRLRQPRVSNLATPLDAAQRNAARQQAQRRAYSSQLGSFNQGMMERLRRQRRL